MICYCRAAGIAILCLHNGNTLETMLKIHEKENTKIILVVVGYYKDP